VTPFTFEMSEDGATVKLCMIPGVTCDMLRQEAKQWWEAAGKHTGKQATQFRSVAKAYEKMADDIQGAALTAKITAQRSTK
jgi:N-glycosylase/DNA lyase